MDKIDQTAKLLSVTDSSIILWPKNVAYDYNLIAEHAKIIPYSNIKSIRIKTDGVFKKILLSTVIGAWIGFFIGSTSPYYGVYRDAAQGLLSFGGSIIGLLSSSVAYAVNYFVKQYAIHGDLAAYTSIKKKLQKQSILKIPLTQEEMSKINR